MRSVSLNVLEDRNGARQSSEMESNIKRRQVVVPGPEDRENQCYVYSSAITATSPKFNSGNYFTNVYSIKPQTTPGLSSHDMIAENLSHQDVDQPRRD